jgi:hypothetical protein
MAGKAKAIYSGVLNTAIIRAPVGLLESNRREQERIERECAKKIALLFEHYKLADAEKPNWMSLAVCLAFDHVPGLAVVDPPRRRGRKRTWQAGLGDDLVRDVVAQKRNGSLTTRQAIAILRKHPPWERFTSQSLETRYREAMKRSAERRQRIARLLLDPPVYAALLDAPVSSPLAMGAILGINPPHRTSPNPSAGILDPPPLKAHSDEK